VTVEGFVLLVPLKPLSTAKSRLALDPETTARLVRAFARDAVDAALSSPLVASVVVVGDQPDVVGHPAVRLLPDEGHGDLNRALALAARRVRGESPGLGVAALCADLPCLVEPDLTSALAAGATGRWFVADASGTGTTLLGAAPDVELDPLFGPGSAGRHADSGAAPVDGPLATLRLDVDTTADLDEAVALGVGRHTAAALALCR
jgi:2-phospho-L-lactate guanylyltransferase